MPATRRQPPRVHAPFDVKTYDAFATSWNSRRETVGDDFGIFWSRVQDWIACAPIPGTTRAFTPRVPLRVLDAGCGGGRHLFELEARLREAKIPFEMAGCDVSSELLTLAKAKAKTLKSSVTLAPGDLTKLPYAADSFDVVVCHAAFHHLTTPGTQAAGARELARVLKPGGLLWMTVLSFECPRDVNAVKRAKENGTYPVTNVPWRTADGTLFDRWYYFFEAEELNGILSKGGLAVTDSFWEGHGKRLPTPVGSFNRDVFATKTR